MDKTDVTPDASYYCQHLYYSCFLCQRTKQNGSIYTEIIQCKGQQVSKRQHSTRTRDTSVNMTSRAQRVAKMLAGIITNLRFKGGFEGGRCAHYSLLSILSLLSCQSQTVDRSGNLGLHPVGVTKLTVSARHCLVHRDLLHLHSSSKGCCILWTDRASVIQSGDAPCALQTQEGLELPCRSKSADYMRSNSTASHAGANTVCKFTQ